MPSPTSARSRMGISTRPYESWFPTIPSPVEIQDQMLRSSPYSVPYAAFDPNLERNAREAGEAQGLIDNFNPDDPEQITGLQRLVGKGLVKPQQANAIFGQVDRNQRAKDREEAMAFRQSMAEQKANRPVAVNKKLSDAFAVASANPTDKAKAAQMKIYGVTDPSKASSEQWKQAFNDTHSEHLNTLRGMVAAAQASGQAVPDEILALVGPQTPVEASIPPSAATTLPTAPNAPTATGTPANSIHELYILQLKNHPESAPFFDKRFGNGAAAAILGK